MKAIEALSTIEPSGPIERAAARLLLAAHKRRLRSMSGCAGVGGEEILSAREHVGDGRAVLWFGEN